MAPRSYRVHVTAEDVDRIAWLQQVDRAAAESENAAFALHIEATGETLLHLQDGWFDWICPTCGGAASGRIGDDVVSGWDSPQWVRSGPRERLSLMPSLGCPRWPNGSCTGHWWLRDGELVPA